MSAAPESGSMAHRARRLVLFDRARSALGGEALAEALGTSRRMINFKFAAERPLHDHDLVGAAGALEARAAELARLAADLRGMVAP